MRIFTVLKSGGEYKPLHVRALERQISARLPGVHFVCLTDMKVEGVRTIPLYQSWPGWWAKMELFRPDILGTILYFDLDTVIAGELDEIATVHGLVLLRDFYRDGTGGIPEGLGSGLMCLPESDRVRPWLEFMLDPHTIMALYRRGGDQAFLERFYRERAYRWQDVVRGIVSWKVHCYSGIPKKTSVICFHGQPKPWQIAQFRPLYDEVPVT